MDRETRRDRALEAIRLGMSRLDALLLAGCDAEDIDALLDDATFMDAARAIELQEEHDLLQKHSVVVTEQMYKGNASAIQWKLSKLNPERWGDRSKVQAELTGGAGIPVQINLVAGKSDDS